VTVRRHALAHAGRAEMGTDICTALAARPTDEPRLNVGKPDVVGPVICRHRDRMAAPVVRTIDQDADRAGGAHLAKRDFHRARIVMSHGP
jgi:hypothetical protein